MKTDLIFQILAAILVVIAAVIFWRGNADWAFAAAVLGACSFFLSVRFQIKERLKLRAEAENRKNESAGDEK